MISQIPPTIPVSDLRNEQAKILEQLHETPILLTQRGRAAAVLVDPDQWNRLLEHLTDLEDAVTGLEAYLEYRDDPSTARPLGEIEDEIEQENAVQPEAFPHG